MSGSERRTEERIRSQSELTEDDNLKSALLIRDEARGLLEMQHYAAALQLYEDALIALEKGVFRPNPSAAWRDAQMQLTYGVVQCLTAMKQHTRAVLLCKSYIDSNPTSFSMRLILAGVLSDTGKYDEALQELRHVNCT